MSVFLKRSVPYGPAGARLLAWLAVFVVSTTATAQSPSAERKVDFGRDVQPIFAKRCFACHGPDKGEGGLRLNQRETALAELDSGEHAVVPGHAGQSEILRRITAADEGERMPPEGKPLDARQIELVRQWIDQGANWEEHWAFQPVANPAIPKRVEKGTFYFSICKRANRKPEGRFLPFLFAVPVLSRRAPATFSASGNVSHQFRPCLGDTLALGVVITKSLTIAPYKIGAGNDAIFRAPNKTCGAGVPPANSRRDACTTNKFC